MQKSIIYTRVSSERQKAEGHGLESQEHRCRELATQKGYEVEKVFWESFSGGGDYTKRPAMSELLAYMDSKPYNSYIVIFDDLKRLARDTGEYIKLREALKLRGAEVECPNFVFDSSPEGKYVETIMAATAQLEREQNRRQVLQKMKARLEIGYWCFPAVPQGYKYIKDSVHGKLPVPVLPNSDIVKEALEGYASGRFLDQEDVRNFLENKNILSGKPVYLEFVKRMLTNIFYAGYIEHPEWEISRRKAKYEALIDLVTFERIQERLKGKVTTHTKNYLNADFPLRSFVLCWCCGQPLTASWSTGRNGKFAYYRCKTKSCLERNKSIRKEKIEIEFEDILRKIQPSKQILDLTKAILADVWKKKEGDNLVEEKQIRKEIDQLESEQQRFVQLAIRAKDDAVVAIYEEQIAELSEKTMVLKNSLMLMGQHKPNIETALDIVFDFLKNPLLQWVKGNIHIKKLVLRLVFEQNLSYNKKSGFETAILSLPIKIFALPVVEKGLLVEMEGIEPSSI